MRITLQNNSGFYNQFQYPAGEWQIRLKPGTLEVLCVENFVEIVARIKSPEDIIKLALLKDCIPTMIRTELVLPYLPYSRADRRFTDGDCNGLAVFGDMINSMKFDKVTTMDVHNFVAATRQIMNLYNILPEHEINSASMLFANRNNVEKVTVLFPDEGAKNRYKITDNRYKCIKDIVFCTKKRDPITGELQGFTVPELSDNPAIIIDDICDGGGTFNGIAQEIQKQQSTVGSEIPLALYITHGIFSKGYDELLRNFNVIYTTDTLEQAPETRSRVVFRTGW